MSNHDHSTASQPATPSTDLELERYRRDTELVVRSVAWASILIGSAELFAPRRTRAAVSVGMAGWWIRLRGLRTIGGGIALLLSDRKTSWLHRRSFANALDVAALARHHDGSLGDRARNAAAIAAIGALTAVDLTAARMTSRQERLEGPTPTPDQPRISRD